MNWDFAEEKKNKSPKPALFDGTWVETVTKMSMQWLSNPEHLSLSSLCDWTTIVAQDPLISENAMADDVKKKKKQKKLQLDLRFSNCQQ